jgi:acid stress-induced BolA-like protein IbaG/YrbA
MSVDAQMIQDLLQQQLPGCEVAVQGAGGKFQVAVIGEVFAGLNAVKRQQLIYQHLNTHIRSGAIHAVSMSRLLTREEAVA